MTDKTLKQQVLKAVAGFELVGPRAQYDRLDRIQDLVTRPPTLEDLADESEYPLQLDWGEQDYLGLTLDEGGEGVRAWSDIACTYQARVPGGVLVLACRGEQGIALAFVPIP